MVSNTGIRGKAALDEIQGNLLPVVRKLLANGRNVFDHVASDSCLSSPDHEKPRLRGIAQEEISHDADYGPGPIRVQWTGHRRVKR